jgi:hypothetical protein
MNLSLCVKFFPASSLFHKDKAKKRKKFWERNFICLSCDDEVPMKDLDENIQQFTYGGVVHGICILCSSLWRQEGYIHHDHVH